MILKTDPRKKVPFIVEVTLYDWAIANLLPADMQEEAVANLPKKVYFKVKSTNKYSAFSSVSCYYSNKSISREAEMYGCLLIPQVFKHYPLYHINVLFEEKVDNSYPIFDLNDTKTLKIPKEYKWKGLPKHSKPVVVSVGERWINKEVNLPEFYKDKIFPIYNTETKEQRKIRQSEYYYEDSPYTLDNNWTKGYAPPKEEDKLPPIYTEPKLKYKPPKKKGRLTPINKRKFKYRTTSSIKRKHTMESSGNRVIYFRKYVSSTYKK